MGMVTRVTYRCADGKGFKSHKFIKKSDQIYIPQKKNFRPQNLQLPLPFFKKDINFETYLRTSNPQVGAKPQDPKSLMGMMKLCCVLP